MREKEKPLEQKEMKVQVAPLPKIPCPETPQHGYMEVKAMAPDGTLAFQCAFCRAGLAALPAVSPIQVVK